ncbi:MAG: cyclase [Enterovirga sp.]|jgi:kynurenine formamidase|nr:cyclase [Enterovirga sp.]
MPETIRIAGREFRVIDLSDRLENATSGFEPSPHRIDYLRPPESPEVVHARRGVPVDVWPNGLGWATEIVTIPTHSGTHVDAPAHYGPRADGSRARTIDEVPLRWCMSDGVLLDFTEKPAGSGITAEDIEAELTRIRHQLKPYDIVLIRTDVSRHFKEPGYEMRHAGLTRRATEYLVDRGVKLIGIDAWGLDRPFDVMLEEHGKGDTKFWEAHLLGREKEYCQIEKLCNLANIPSPTGFTVLALPILLADASAAWSRVVALVEN